MVTYIYFVKCPNCEDEHFDFFDEAKEYALGCMGQKPIITQVEVERNDFGECTDSHDLGTVWSWEDVMKDTCTDDKLAKCIFTKDDLKGYIPDEDPEFAALDNSVDCCTPRLTEAATTEFIDLGEGHKISKEALYDELAINGNDITIPLGDLGISNDDIHFSDYGYYAGSELNIYKDGNEFSITVWHSSDDGDLVEGDSFESKSFEEFWQKLTTYVDVELEESCERKPIPEGMTIEQLVEEMEENEDTVECTWCEELFDKSECRKEVDLGWLCSRCEMAIKSRGETLTFREGSYWDFLDEKLDLDLDFSNCVESSAMEIWGLEHTGENFYKTVLLKRFNDVSFKGPEDEAQKVYDEMYDIDGMLTFSFGKDGLPVLNAWNVNSLRKLGRINIEFEDTRYEDAAAAAWGKTPVREEVEELHDLGNEYDGGYPEENHELPEIDEVSDSHLKLCPECGKESFDIETGICVDCGFN